MSTGTTLYNSNNTITLSNNNNNVISLNNTNYANSIAFCFGINSEPSVTLNNDGTITFHSDQTLDEMAKKFWECMAHCNPLRDEYERLKKENERYKSGHTTLLYSLDIPVTKPSTVRVEFDGAELRARNDMGTWQTVKIEY